MLVAQQFFFYYEQKVTIGLLQSYIYSINSDWLVQNHPNERRQGSMIFEADNILKPEYIQTIYEVRKSMDEIVTPNGATWDNTCIKVPGELKLHFLCGF